MIFAFFQVFLLDTQIKRDADPESESEADKSFVFLLYKPGDENSLNPDDIVTRLVKFFRHYED